LDRPADDRLLITTVGVPTCASCARGGAIEPISVDFVNEQMTFMAHVEFVRGLRAIDQSTVPDDDLLSEILALAPDSEQGRRILDRLHALVGGRRSELLHGVVPPYLAGLALDLLGVGKRLDAFEHISRAPGEQMRQARAFLGAALALGLASRGFGIVVSGWRLLVGQGDRFIDPFEIVLRLANRQISGEAWEAWCAELGVSAVDLESVALDA
jgi:hypothetical protein